MSRLWPRLLAGTFVGTGALGFWAGWELSQRGHAPEEAVRHEHQAQALDQKAEDLRPALERSRTEVQRLARQVARLRALHPLPPPPPESGPSLVPRVAGEPLELLDLVTTQDELIQAQARRIGLLESQLTTLEGARNEWRTAYQAVPKTKARPWSAGLLWAPPQASRGAEWGALLRRDLGPAFIQIEAFKDRAALAAGWRW